MFSQKSPNSSLLLPPNSFYHPSIALSDALSALQNVSTSPSELQRCDCRPAPRASPSARRAPGARRAERPRASERTRPTSSGHPSGSPVGRSEFARSRRGHADTRRRDVSAPSLRERRRNHTELVGVSFSFSRGTSRGWGIQKKLFGVFGMVFWMGQSGDGAARKSLVTEKVAGSLYLVSPTFQDDRCMVGDSGCPFAHWDFHVS